MKYIPYKVLKILAIILHVFYSLIFPKYSRYGQRKITIPQKLTILTLAKAFGLTYREMPLLAEDLRESLGIKHVPTFQNFERFEKTIKPQTIQDTIEVSAILVLKRGREEKIILVDSTGFQIMDASSYYNYRAQKAADFFKLHVVMDLETKVIILATPSDRYYHDINPMRQYFIKELRRLADMFGFKIKAVSADSSYASEDIYNFIKGSLNATPAIKPNERREKPREGLTALFWRLRNLPWFRKLSNLRWVLESMFKVFKRLFGSFVRGKNWRSRSNEVLFKALAWNIFIMAVTHFRP